MVEPTRLIYLPSELLCSQLVDWLEMEEVVLVDSALCNHKYRHVLMHTVSPLCVLHVKPKTKREKNAMLWITKRGLQAKFMILYDSAINTECRQFLENSRKFVKHVVVRSEKESKGTELLEILTACPDMDSLYVWTSQLKCSEEVLKHSGFTLSRLQSISVYCETSYCVGTTIVNAVCAASNRIKRVELRCGAEHALQQLLDIGSFENLVALSIYLANGLSDANLIGLLRKTPHLVHLSLCLCQHLTDESGVFLAEHATNLQTLDISFCDLSNATMMALATHCARTLHALNIHYCANIDATGLRTVLEKCTKLRVLRADTMSIPWTLLLLQNLIVLILGAKDDEVLLNHISKVPYLCGSLQYVSLRTCIGHIDFSAFTVQNMPFLRRINIANYLKSAVDLYPTLDALQVLRPTLKVSFGPVDDYFDVMKLPL